MERYHVGGDHSTESCHSNKNNNNELKEVTGLTRITKKRLKELCKKDKLYQTPALNDVLYLHYQGIHCIECLEEYTGLKCLWLECNAISEIQGLEHQKELKCLFLQSNLIKRIENLEHCPQLDTLNLASNHIRKIENCGVDVLPVLSTLNLSSNYLKDFDGLKDLENCKSLSVLDLSNNRIDDILVVKIFAKMPQLRVLVLQGNPVVSKVPQYRKTLILECQELTYLDSRPVFPKDRACAEAWKRDGYEGERKENERWKRMERKKIRDSVNATIRMRNKHRPADQQDPLFNSSDSEEDCAEVKRARQAEVDAGINMELGIWEEVVNEDSKSQTSLDMNVSSSTSGLSTTDSNANISADSKSIGLQHNLDNEAKVANDSQVTKSQALAIATDGNFGSILKLVDVSAKEGFETNANKVAERKRSDVTVGQKRVLIEEWPEIEVANEENAAEITSGVIERLLDKATLPTFAQKSTELDKRLSVTNLSDSDDAAKDEYNATVDAIGQITMHDLSKPSPKKRIKLQIEVDEESLDVMETEQDRLARNYDIIETETREKVVEETCEESDDIVLFNQKTVEQMKYELECAEVNEKVVADFEELSSQMDNFIEEMQKDQEALGVQREKNESILDNTFETESTETTYTELEEYGARLDVLHREPTPELYVAAVLEHVARVDSDVATKMTTISDMEKCEKQQEEGNSSGADVPTAASSLEKVNVLTSIGPNADALRNDVPGDHADLSAPVIETLFDDCGNGVDMKIEKIVPADTLNFSKPQEKALATFESEERELRQLLQRLENENEQLYNINSAYRCALAEDINEEIKYRENENSEQMHKVCEEIITDLLDELILVDQRADDQWAKPKSYQFGEIESDEEYCYSDPPKPPEPPVRSIRDVLSSFNELLQEISRKNKAEEERKEHEYKEAIHQKYASTDAQKAESLENLLKSPNLRNFNGDTSELLDQKIAEEKKRESKRVRKLVDRVYAQKDKYNDTLEVVDGKLVVVKKDTGKIEDLPASKFNYSDSEDTDQYESAQSDDEQDTGKAGRVEIGVAAKLHYKPREIVADGELGTKMMQLWDARVRQAESAGTFRLPYRPTERIPAMQLIQKANEWKEKENAACDAADEEENEQFYSLEAAKPTVFRDLDEDFIDKMDFEKAELQQANESELVECARSYTELKRIMKGNKEELNLTDDENFLLQKMLGLAEQKETEAKQTKDPLTVEENELLQKMVQRTKEKEKEKPGGRHADAKTREQNAKPTLSKQKMKIIELTSDENSQSSGVDGENPGNFINIKQLDAEYPIPGIFRDMLDDYDLGAKTPKMRVDDAEPELTVLFTKQTKERMELKADEPHECGLFRDPLELGRGGIAYTQEGDKDEFKEIDTSYDDVLPAEDESEELWQEHSEEYNELGDDKLVQEQEKEKHKKDTAEKLLQKCESLRDVAVSVLKFDGSNYEEYGITEETARGVVEYEKMLNFGKEDEEEFVDAPMREEQLVKIVTEALKKDELKEKKGVGVGDVGDVESSCDKFRLQVGDVFQKKRLQAVEKKECEAAGKTVAKEFKPERKHSEYTKAKAPELENKWEDIAETEQENIDEPDFADMSKENVKQLENLEKEITNYLDQFDLQIQTNADEKETMDDVKFQDVSEEYKDFPAVGSKAVAALEVADSDKVGVEVDGSHNATPALTNPSDVYTDFPAASAAHSSYKAEVLKVTEAASLRETFSKLSSRQNESPNSNSSFKNSHTHAGKASTFESLLKSPILKQFNEDTSASLNAQIQAAKVDDFDLIECSLEVIGDDDEVVNEISVSAEITYNP
ncbi:LOW QUALITY PROTEIN: dynein assembly factor 1, axonemal homolog [Rhagoletis pomonella]|uniref:LOW QUALITY PROTEIN: dynein assembly factor 1, axonemal homolog n=1 Tax=Rhagoletis pomonella TaxID=28610 RepID=UPI001785A4D7|nr:LOW QUALITY PROTEIN: dynein assembly factor 1, axonemal homolog [Rhagoletis pomonella]